MASPIVKGQAFGTTETVTAAKLQNIVDNASFKDFDGSTEVFNVSGSTDIGTCVLAGGLAVKTSTGQLQIKDNGVTLAKMATQADQTVLGNVSGGTAVPTAVPIVGGTGILINDDALGTSDTKGATQGNIKAYADGGDIGVGQTWQNVTRALDETSYTNSTGKPIMVKGRFSGNTDDHTIKIFVTPSGGSEVEIVFAIGTNSGGSVVSDGCIIIPNNTSYKFSKAGNTITFFQFTELR